MHGLVRARALGGRAEVLALVVSRPCRTTTSGRPRAVRAVGASACVSWVRRSSRPCPAQADARLGEGSEVRRAARPSQQNRQNSKQDRKGRRAAPCAIVRFPAMRARRVILVFWRARARAPVPGRRRRPASTMLAAAGATDEQWTSARTAASPSTARGRCPRARDHDRDLDVGVQLDHSDLRAVGAGGHDFYSVDDDPTSDTHNEHAPTSPACSRPRRTTASHSRASLPRADLPLRTSTTSSIRLAAGRGDPLRDRPRRDGHLDVAGRRLVHTRVRAAVRYAAPPRVVMAVASATSSTSTTTSRSAARVLAVGASTRIRANLAARDRGWRSWARTSRSRRPTRLRPAPRRRRAAQVPTTTWGAATDDRDGRRGDADVAAVAALVQARAKALGLHLTADQVMQIIRTTAVDSPIPRRATSQGGTAVGLRARRRAARGAAGRARDDPPEARSTRRSSIAARPPSPSRAWPRVRGGSRWAPARSPISGRRGDGPRAAVRARVEPAALGPGGYTLRLK